MDPDTDRCGQASATDENAKLLSNRAEDGAVYQINQMKNKNLD